TLAQLAQQRAAESTAVETRRLELERVHEQATERLARIQTELEEKSATIEQRELDVAQHLEQLSTRAARLKEIGKNAASARKSFAERRAYWETERRDAEAALARASEEINSVRSAVAEQQL